MMQYHTQFCKSSVVYYLIVTLKKFSVLKHNLDIKTADS